MTRRFFERELCLVLHLSVEQTIGLATALLGAGALLALLAGLRSLVRAPRQAFYLLRREAFQAGWRLIILAAGFAGLAGIVRAFGIPTAFHYVVPTPTITLTPSLTLPPTITLTPTITPTPTSTRVPTGTVRPEPTDTLAPTPTPRLPPSVAQSFSVLVTPEPDAVIGPVTVAKYFTPDYRPFNPSDVFINPVSHLYAFFTYAHMNFGVQWTAVWYRDQVVVYYESHPWDGGAAGNGFTDWNVAPGFFPPGSYGIQIFVGSEWESSGRFMVVGNPPTDTPTSTLTPTPTLSATPPPPLPRMPTLTPVPSETRMPTATEWTPPPTSTAHATVIPVPSDTRWPTATTPG
ncbi:MAG: hypothetical protein ABSG98_04900 [Anaerolineales bacterium]|jgi:hypothetical protein